MNNLNNTQNSATTIELVPIDEILAKGTIFEHLYEPYKNIPDDDNPTSDEEKLMREIQTYAIAACDLNLYLDVYPNDKQGVKLYNEIIKRLKAKTDEYEQNYGIICLISDTPKSVPWDWVLSNWPWLGER